MCEISAVHFKVTCFHNTNEQHVVPGVVLVPRPLFVKVLVLSQDLPHFYSLILVSDMKDSGFYFRAGQDHTKWPI